MLPAVYTHHIVELVKRWGVTKDELLGPLGIAGDNLDDPSVRMPLSDVERIVERAVALTGETGLGFYLALDMRISWHGYLGFAAMTAATMRQALELAERFMPTRTTALELRFVVAGEPSEDASSTRPSSRALPAHASPPPLPPGMASLLLEEKAPMKGHARDVLVVGVLLGIGNIGDALAGRVLDGHAELALPKPRDFEKRFMRANERVVFDAPAHRLVFPKAMLDVPLAFADPAALKLATERCEEELRALGFDRRASVRIRALLETGWPSAAEAAKALSMSVRTLKRRLADEGTSYSDVVDDIRRQRAQALLRNKALTVAEVADKLGYADAAGFTHAFRRWTGHSPAAFRDRL